MNDEFDPNDYFIGTTWERITEKFIFARNPDNNKYNISGLTGGEETHILTQEEIPSTFWHTDKISRDSICLSFNSGSTYGINSNPDIKVEIVITICHHILLLIYGKEYLRR